MMIWNSYIYRKLKENFQLIATQKEMNDDSCDTLMILKHSI
jgi:hypothetical protein